MPITSILFAATLISTINPPKMQAEPFPLDQVKLLDGPLAHANKVCADYLLKVEPDRLLHSFRKHAGLEPKGKIYGGWESAGLAGHSLGHYMTACAQEYASTKDVRYKEKVNYIVSELVECQKARPDGCISAIPNGDKAFAEIKKGDIRSGGFDLNGMWAPWYTHHKVMAGLLDADLLVGNKQAIGVAEKFAGWAIETTKDLTPELWQKMLGCEYGGINESLAELYHRTGKTQYLELSRKFYDTRVLEPLSRGEDSLPGKHSNTQIPKLIGLARLYEITGQEKDQKTARFFWETVVKHHTYAIGGNSNGEYLGPPDQLSDRLSSNTAETCNTYNMLKLTRHLIEWDPKAEYADYYERAHLNHILASQNPKDAMMTYFMPLASGAHRNYSNPFNDFTCCHGSGMENHTKHADSIYFHSGSNRLYVNLFVPSELNWKQNKVQVVQTTNYPSDGKVTLTVQSAKPLELAIRHPGWAKGEVAVKINGKVAAKSDKPSSYILIKRTWRKDDKVEFELPMQLRTEAMPDNPKRVALMYGPVVLAANLGPAKGDWPRIPVLVTGNRPVSDWLEKVPGKTLTFKTKGIGRPADLTFQPFYAIHEDRYATYFDEFTDEQWKKEEAEFRAEEIRVRDLESRTVDAFRIGEMQPERDHKLKSEKNDVREANGRGFRTPLNGGWMEFESKVDAAKPVELVMTYWGNERIRPDFTILVDGKQIAADKLEGRPNNRFYDVVYAIPAEMTKDKTHVVVKIQAADKKAGPSVAGVRVVRVK
jgi:uncharacterized protein